MIFRTSGIETLVPRLRWRLPLQTVSNTHRDHLELTLLPEDRMVRAAVGGPLADVLAQAGAAVTQPCGGAGTCGKCRVRWVKPAAAPAPTRAEAETFSPAELSTGWRLACQHFLAEDLAVFVPPLSRLGLGAGAMPTPESVAPIPPTGDKRLALAFDVGTTSLAAAVVDAATGLPLAIATAANPQRRFGADVISRIRLCRERPDAVAELQQAVLETMGRLAGSVLGSAGGPPEHVSSVAVAGNSVMQHLVLGVSPASLGEAPYEGLLREGVTRTAGDLGLPPPPLCPVYVFPCIRGFLGGDTVAGTLITGMAERPGIAESPTADGPSLLIDLGTNGEVVLAHAGKLWAAVAAAGPAFEGGEISCGMTAAPGAIDSAWLDDGELKTATVDGRPPVGLCGSGLIDVAACLLETGAVSITGALKKRRVRLAEHADLWLTAADVRQLQLASGAIRAATQLLLAEAGVAASDVARVFLAGAFGAAISPRSARRIGLFPNDIPAERIQPVGNASLLGAQQAAVDVGFRDAAERLARSITVVNLAANSNFTDTFAEAMIFP